MTDLVVVAPAGVPEVGPGTDLAELATSLLDLRDGDVLLVTSKAVAKAEGLVSDRSKDELVAEDTVRVVARRGPLTIARHRLGLTLAAAGVDESNVAAGRVVPLPRDPDGSARDLRSAVRRRTGVNVGVVVTDTAGRPWRLGQTDIAVGAAGVVVLESFAGLDDGYGHQLQATEPAAADELAAAAELAQGKLGRRPLALVRGRADLVLPAGDDGPGAAALVRPESDDLFGLGTREAVVRAVLGDPADRPAYGAPASATELAEALGTILGEGAVTGLGTTLTVAPAGPLVAVVAFAHGWRVVSTSADSALLQPFVP